MDRFSLTDAQWEKMEESVKNLGQPACLSWADRPG